MGCPVRHRRRRASPGTGRETLWSGSAASADLDHHGPRLPRRSAISTCGKRRRAGDPGARRASVDRTDHTDRSAVVQRRRRASDRAAVGRAETAGAHGLAKGRRVIVLSGADVVLPDRVLSPGTIVIDGGRIVEIKASGTTAGGVSHFAFHGHYI